MKPTNCLFVRGELKLADFGLLTEAEPGISRVGTLSYMPPDSVMDMQADVYAAGLVIYEMITGSPVSRFPTLQSRTQVILANHRLAALNRLVVKACDPDRNARLADAVAMLEELERLLDETTPGAAGSTMTPLSHIQGLPRRLVVASVCGLGLLVVAGFASWLSVGPSSVDVNFITDRFNATIWLDGEPLRKPDGTLYTTPCTVPSLSADEHELVFRYPGLDDLEVGRIDFSKIREIVAHWPN